MTVLLKAKNLKKSFHSPKLVEVLKDIELTVSQGETVAIMGRSGEGKSTLLHILGTLEPADKGELTIAQQNINRNNAARIRNRHIGFVFQAFYLLEDYTVLDNVLFPARIGRQDVSEKSPVRERAVQLLETVGLRERMHFNAKLLSGGEKQRVAIVRGLINNPDLLLADEPSGNLDAQNAENIHSILINFAKKEKKGLVIVTHDPYLAKICETAYTLKNGILHPG